MDQIPASIERFFTPDSRLRVMPAKPAPRRLVLRWIAAQTVGPEEKLAEVDLNLRLRRYHEDTAMLRRYMVDLGIIARDPAGRDYTLAPIKEETDGDPS